MRGEIIIKKRPGHLVMFKELPKDIKVVNDRYLLFFKIQPGKMGTAKIYRIVEIDKDNITKVEPFAGLSFSSINEFINIPLNYNTFWDILSPASKIRIEPVYLTTNPHIILDIFTHDDNRVATFYFPPFYFDIELRNNKVYVKCCNSEQEIINISYIPEVVAFVQTLDYISALEIIPLTNDESIDVSLKLKKVDGDSNGIITTTKVIEIFERIVEDTIQKIMSENQIDENVDNWKKDVIIKNTIQKVINELRIKPRSLVNDEPTILQKYVTVKVFLKYNDNIIKCAKLLDETFKTTMFSELLIDESIKFVPENYLSE